MDLWDDDSWFVLSARHVQLARDAGALTVLPLALNRQAGIHLFAGQFTAAEALVEEARAVSDAIGNPDVSYARVILASLRGRKGETSRLTGAGDRDATARGEGRMIGAGGYAIESAARSGKADLASDGLRRLSEMTGTTGTDWALGVEARLRALVSEGETAEALYRRAIEAVKRTRIRLELARAHLLYGEWLRRENRRLDAREQLRIAHEMFTEFGMEAFAERARVELEATGEHARKRTVETRDDLTPQEAQICRLAADGATNQDIAAQLFISPSTVDYHLRKAFRKLGVKSRHQLKQQVLQPHTSTEPGSRGR
jgi:DNA-binding CsgD family transcriptional regulator